MAGGLSRMHLLRRWTKGSKKWTKTSPPHNYHGVAPGVWFMRNPLLEIATVQPVFGVLELVGGDTVRFTAVAGGGRPTQLLEQFAEKPGLAERLSSGEKVIALEVLRSEARITFPRWQVGSILKLRAHGKTWRFAF